MTNPTLANLGVSRLEKTLSNGIRVILFEKANSPVSLRVAFTAGSRYDPLGKEGIAHFVEHMLVAGTKKFPQKDKLALYIEREGGGIGASTSREILRINSGISEPVDIDILTSVVGEVLTAPLFDPSTIETERGSILKEIGASLSSAQKRGGRKFSELLFQGTVFEHPTLGTSESVGSITRKDLLDYYREYILPQRATIIASGGISIEALCDSLEKNIKFQNQGKHTEDSGGPLEISRNKNQEIIYDGASEHVYILFGFRTVPVTSPDVPVLDIISDIVGSGRSSIFSKRLRYDKGLTYSASASSGSLRDSGDWSINASTSSENVKEVIEIMLSILREIKDKGLSQDMINSRKEAQIKSLRVRFERGESWVESHSYTETIKSLQGKTILDYIRHYEAVTNEDIIRVAQKYFRNDGWYMVLAGKITKEQLPSIEL